MRFRGGGANLQTLGEVDEHDLALRVSPTGNVDTDGGDVPGHAALDEIMVHGQPIDLHCPIFVTWIKLQGRNKLADMALS
jgi:hypothetical protein